MTHLMEGIGIALDVPGDRMFVTDFAGSIYSARLDGSGEAQFPLRPGQSHRHRLRRNLTDQRRTDHVQQQAHSPHRHHRHRRHRRELDGAVSRQGTATSSRPIIAPNAEAALRKFVETAWPALEAIGPVARRIAVERLTFTADIDRRAVRAPTSSRRTGPSGSISSRSSMASSTSCCRPT